MVRSIGLGSGTAVARSANAIIAASDSSLTRRSFQTLHALSLMLSTVGAEHARSHAMSFVANDEVPVGSGL
jgi:hypothetical protein